MPLFRYLREAPKLRGAFDFGDYRYVGLGAAMHALVLEGRGVAVLPHYMVDADLRKGRLVRLLPRIELLTDHFKLVFRSDDPRRGIYSELAQCLRSFPIS